VACKIPVRTKEQRDEAVRWVATLRSGDEVAVHQVERQFGDVAYMIGTVRTRNSRGGVVLEETGEHFNRDGRRRADPLWGDYFTAHLVPVTAEIRDRVERATLQRKLEGHVHGWSSLTTQQLRQVLAVFEPGTGGRDGDA
jgi:hypothetical protein